MSTAPAPAPAPAPGPQGAPPSAPATVEFVCAQCRKPMAFTVKPSAPGAAAPSADDEDMVIVRTYQEHQSGHIVDDPTTVRAHAAEAAALLRNAVDLPPVATFGQETAYLARMLDLVSMQSGVDLPVCARCADGVSRHLQEKVDGAAAQLEKYRALLERLERDPSPAVDTAALERELKQNEVEEDRLRADLADATRERSELLAQLAALQSQEEELEGLEERYWMDVNSFALNLGMYADEKAAIERSIQRYAAQLEMLSHTNVLNDCFHVWHDGRVGTINNLRLSTSERVGSLPAVPLDEMNAALGQMCLFADSIVRRMGVQLQFSRLLPCGSYSRVKDLRSGHEECLYMPDANMFTRSGHRKAFQAGLRQFALVLVEMIKHAERLYPGFRPAYTVDGERVDGKSITVYDSNPEEWTDCMLRVLDTLKHLLMTCTADASPPQQQQQQQQQQQVGSGRV